jgi:CheY-like chemotaxis protein/CRP-like cAMP-binding protein
MKSILVVEDNADIRDNIEEILELAGYKVFTAENGRKGLETALKEKPDVIVCDIMMPELDGYGLLHVLRKNPETQHIPLIFLTAKSERSDFRKGMEMGADDYISKPFEDIELLNAIDIRIKKSELLTQNYAPDSAGISKFIKDVNDTGLMTHLTEQYDTQTFSKKHKLYQETKRPKYLYYIISGKVKGFKVHEDGKEYITNLFGPGDFLSYSAIIEEKNYDDSAEVLENTEVLQIPKDDFLQMIYSDISIAVKFIRLFTQNVKEKEDRLLSMAYGSLRKRIAKALLDIYTKFSVTSEGKLIEISRDDIAHYVGTATESLIRTLSDFKSEKLIDIRDGKITIPAPEKMKNLLY